MTDVKNMTERESYIIAQALYEFIRLEQSKPINGRRLSDERDAKAKMGIVRTCEGGSMTDKQTALKDVRKRQTAAVRRAFAGNRPTLIGRDEVNAILRDAGLPEAQDETEVDHILNDRDGDPPAEVQAFQAAVIAQFLREGGYTSLADAMQQLGLSEEGIWAVIQKRMIDLLQGSSS
jgi:hypothetical protein